MIRSNTGNASIGMTDGTPTKVYDADAKKLLAEFDSNGDAAKFLGVPTSYVRYAKNRRSVLKPETNILNKRIAIR